MIICELGSKKGDGEAEGEGGVLFTNISTTMGITERLLRQLRNKVKTSNFKRQPMKWGK